VQFYKQIFNKAGWFIPSYVTMGYIQTVARELKNAEKPDIEKYLKNIYSSESLAAMVTERYPEVPYIKDYKAIISEAIEAHFLGLDHVATTGLIPVIEGVGMELVELWGIDKTFLNKNKKKCNKGIRTLYTDLATKCKAYVIERDLGMVSEIVPALEAFEYFLNNDFYVQSDKYKHEDKTNRHGILHGAFKDNDFGKPLNFYKTIGAIEFLCFIISLREPISFFAPSQTKKSQELAKLYSICSSYKNNSSQFKS
jgi:hypothetical protein